MRPVSPLILVVDDDIDVLTWTSCVLESAGYRPLCSCSVDEAIDSMAREKPALVITDLMMDSFHSGFTFAQRLRSIEQYKEIPIIVVTGAASKRGLDFSPRTAEDLEAMQVDALFAKPVRPEDLLAKIESLLIRARAVDMESAENEVE
jgi:CheY-like chemotaxis protein